MTTRWPLEHVSAVEMEPGRFHVVNHETGQRFDFTREQLAAYLREHGRSADHVPLGDYVHNALEKVGIKGCLPCAERQARLNRLVRKRRKG